MIVILVISLCVTHVFKYGNSAYISEGMENKEDDTSVPKADDKPVNKKIEKTKPVSKDVVADKDLNETDKKDKIEYADLKKDYDQFQDIQQDIIKGMQKIEPLLSKAENFITKFENYKIQNTGG
jgi:hypothetical protein